MWIDGHHEKVATIHYFQRLMPVLNTGALVFFDDIRWSQDMYDGWEELRRWSGFSHTVDLGSIGLGVWSGGDQHPKMLRMTHLRGRSGISHPHGWRG